MQQPELIALIKLCVSEDRTAQAAIYNHYVGYIYNLVRRYVQIEDEAKDVTQETFIQLFKSISSFDKDKGTFKAWLSKIAINKALKSIEKKKGLEISFDPRIHDLGVPQNNIDLSHSMDELMSLFNGMPDAYRMVFDLFVIEGFSHNEIAGMLEISSQNSRVLLNRGRQWLRVRMENKQTKITKSL